jgi:hypothetical protein
LVTLDYRSQRLVARLAADTAFEPGHPVWIRLPPDRVIEFDAATGERLR